MVAIDVEVVDLLGQDLGEGVENAGVEELEDAYLDHQGGVHVGLGDITLPVCHEDQEYCDDSVEDGQKEC